jgi:1-acyl-sn-glycerol-3-phosphate acyltransferase
VIRTLWAAFVAIGATYFYGTIVLVAGLFGVRGGVYSGSTRRWARAILRASAVPVRLVGEGHLRADTPQIVVSNHVSGYDIFALASVVPEPFAFVGKKELDSIPFFGRAWKAAGHISIDRSNRQQAIATLQEAGRRIREEHSTVIIFAEGTRSKTGELQPLKKGAFALALEAGVPIVPTVIIDSERIMRGKLGRVHPTPITIHFGEPILPGKPGSGAIDAVLAATQARMAEMLAAGRAASRVGSGEGAARRHDGPAGGVSGG